jgi:hypothetical protein
MSDPKSKLSTRVEVFTRATADAFNRAIGEVLAARSPWQLLYRLSRIDFLGLVLHPGWILVVVQPDLARRLMLPQTPSFQQRHALHREQVRKVLQTAVAEWDGAGSLKQLKISPSSALTPSGAAAASAGRSGCTDEAALSTGSRLGLSMMCRSQLPRSAGRWTTGRTWTNSRWHSGRPAPPAISVSPSCTRQAMGLASSCRAWPLGPSLGTLKTKQGKTTASRGLLFSTGRSIPVASTSAITAKISVQGWRKSCTGAPWIDRRRPARSST